MMSLFARLCRTRLNGSRLASHSLDSFSKELSDAIDSAVVSTREPNDDGPRVMVLCHALRGAFIFDREEAARRIRLGFPELSDEAVKRGVSHLESRVRLAIFPRDKRRASWVYSWTDGER